MATAVTRELSADLRGFRRVQRPACDCAKAVAARPAPGMPYILDLAPVLEGYTADVGHSAALVGHPVQERLTADPAAHRELVEERRVSPRLFGFGTESLKGLAADAPHGHREGCSPLWSPQRGGVRRWAQPKAEGQ